MGSVQRWWPVGGVARTVMTALLRKRSVSPGAGEDLGLEHRPVQFLPHLLRA